MREHNFWVYPKHKALINSCWDTYNASDLCNNYTFLDESSCSQVKRYKCNGHVQGDCEQMDEDSSCSIS